ncbi:hypothetical protein ISS30_06015 [bacterium]|nr:hypothetical protein [bacterium]
MSLFQTLAVSAAFIAAFLAFWNGNDPVNALFRGAVGYFAVMLVTLGVYYLYLLMVSAVRRNELMAKLKKEAEEAERILKEAEELKKKANEKRQILNNMKAAS